MARLETLPLLGPNDCDDLFVKFATDPAVPATETAIDIAPCGYLISDLVGSGGAQPLHGYVVSN